jgi:hypothetical protein
VGFLNPIGLALGVLYAVLVLLYLWEQSRHRLEVPSLLLWKTVPEETFSSARPRFDLLFVLQALLLTLLIGSLARPYFTSPSAEPASGRHVFVLDISASMQVFENKATRFQAARAALRKRLKGLPEGDEVMLITAAHRPRVVVSFTQDHAELLRLLDQLEPVETGTNLDLALAVARSAATRTDLPTRIELFTDASPSSSIDDEIRSGVRVFQFGERGDNLAVLGLQIFQPRFQDHRAVKAQILVRNFSAFNAHAFLTVDVEDETSTRQGFSLGPGEERTFLVGGFQKAGVVRARLDGEDALASDNVAFGWVRPASTLHVLVVSETSSLHTDLDRIDRATPNLRFHFMSPEDYAPGLEGNADLVVFRRFVPDLQPLRPALYIHPPAGNARFRVLGEVTGLKILDWNDRHPAMHELQPVGPHPLSHVQWIDPPRWTEVLISSRHDDHQIPLAFAGERGGRRVACTAFDLADENLLGADNVALLLVFLNLLDWLSPEDEMVSIVRTGEIQTLADLSESTLHVTGPRGRVLTLPASRDAEPLSLEPLHTGAYVIAAGEERRQVLANLFDPSESDVSRRRREPPGDAFAAAPSASLRYPSTEVTPLLLLAAAILFVVEWLVATKDS